MTAPTAHTAPLPSLLPCPFCGMAPEFKVSRDDNIIGVVCPEGSPCRGAALFVCFDSTKRDSAIEAWNRRSDAALLTMQRERDEALAKLNREENAHAELQARCFDNGQPTGGSIFGEIVELRGQLGACKQQLAASERTCAEHWEALLKWKRRAEAAERTIGEGGK